MFNLEKTLEGFSIQTIGGYNARIICHNRKMEKNGINYPLVVFVQGKDNDNEQIISYTEDGEPMNGNLNYKLIMAPIKKEAWINLYKYHNGIMIGCQQPFHSYEEAFNSHVPNDDYIDTIKIEWNE